MQVFSANYRWGPLIAGDVLDVIARAPGIHQTGILQALGNLRVGDGWAETKQVTSDHVAGALDHLEQSYHYVQGHRIGRARRYTLTGFVADGQQVLLYALTVWTDELQWFKDHAGVHSSADVQHGLGRSSGEETTRDRLNKLQRDGLLLKADCPQDKGGFDMRRRKCWTLAPAWSALLDTPQWKAAMRYLGTGNMAESFEDAGAVSCPQCGVAHLLKHRHETCPRGIGFGRLTAGHSHGG